MLFFFELVKNNTFGKIVKYIKNHKCMKLVTNRERYAKYVTKPNLKDGYLLLKEIFPEEMAFPL